jgi:hypothetical protein
MLHFCLGSESESCNTSVFDFGDEDDDLEKSVEIVRQKKVPRVDSV